MTTSQSTSPLTQEAYDAAADAALAEGGTTPEAINPNQIARRLGKKTANATFYNRHEDWLARRTSARKNAPMALPAEVMEKLEHAADRLKAAFMAESISSIGEIGRALDQQASLRTASAEQIAARAISTKQQMLEDWAIESASLDAAEVRIATLTYSLDEALTKIAKLEGRLEQVTADRNIALAAAYGRQADGDVASSVPPKTAADTADVTEQLETRTTEDDDGYRPF